MLNSKVNVALTGAQTPFMALKMGLPKNLDHWLIYANLFG